MSFYFQGIDPPSLITARESAPRRVGFPFSQVLLCNFGLLNMNATIVVVASRCFLCENKIYKVAIEPYREVGVDVHRCIQSNRLTGAVNRYVLQDQLSVRWQHYRQSTSNKWSIYRPDVCKYVALLWAVRLTSLAHCCTGLGKINGQLN